MVLPDSAALFYSKKTILKTGSEVFLPAVS